MAILLKFAVIIMTNGYIVEDDYNEKDSCYIISGHIMKNGCIIKNG